MKAIVFTQYGPPEVLKIVEVDKPVPKENEVLIKVHAAVVSSADCTFRRGEPYFARLYFGILKPRTTILGTEFAGQIEAVGKDVKNFTIGDKVIGAPGAAFGAHAEYIAIAEDGALALMPSNLSYAEAAGVCEGGNTALPFLRDEAKITSGQKILINGASGSVGSSAVQLAKHFGAEVTGVCSTPNLDFVKSLGADHVIDYTSVDFTRGSYSYDFVFDTVGKSSYCKCKNILKQSGVYLATVFTFTHLTWMLWTSIIGSKKVIFAATGLRPAYKQAKDMTFLKELAESGVIKPTISKTYKPHEIAEAHRLIETGHKRSNVVLSFDE
ncbi:MAG TPA: NAD(P)-dependent alcohol dehydrogenase [Thermodesulfobacteriota bacterium]|nr:NAD(P)-dependent alcohol dehydrogenase [Thermodesulfobacteriota bacterium]